MRVASYAAACKELAKKNHSMGEVLGPDGVLCHTGYKLRSGGMRRIYLTSIRPSRISAALYAALLAIHHVGNY